MIESRVHFARALAVLALVSSMHVEAYESCNALLRHGITERMREQRVDNRSQRIESAICEAYSRYVQDSQGGGAKASYGLFDGSASFSRNQIESVGKSMCQSNLSDTASNALLETASDKISQAAVTAWRECNDLYRDGLRAETQFRDDNGTVAIRIRYVQPTGVTATPQFSAIAIFPKDSFRCDGPLAKMKTGDQITSSETAMLCERDNTKKEVVGADGQTVVLPASSISVMTTAGSITRHVSPMFKAALPFTQRLGEVVASMLDQKQFAEVYGSGWVLADGRAVANTEYARLVGANVPDLRGVYLRGKNYARDRARGNAEGDLALGTYQAFQLARHSHSTVQMIGDNNVDGVDSTTTRSGEHHNEPRQTGEFGGDEVRPNSVTVNFFIRVDGR